MPILVDKDSHWTESGEAVQLILPLKGTSPQNVDIFCTTEYLKVSYPPYLFEALLRHKIDTQLSKIIIANGYIQINLKKIEFQLWVELKSDLQKNKEIMQQKRKEALEEAQKRCENSVAERAQVKEKQKKDGVSKQMDLDSSIKRKIENVKETERKLATLAIEELRQENEESLHEIGTGTMDEGVKNSIMESEETSPIIETKKCVKFDLESDNSKCKTKPQTKNSIISKNRIFPKISGKSISDIFSTEKKPNQPIRSQGTIQCQFTPRHFPTPERESKKQEEDEWLAKLAEARRTPKSEPNPELEPNDIQNTNPQWLKDKGDQLYKSADYLSSYNVYSEAVNMETTLPSIYANRALCLLKMARFDECIQDCGEALKLLVPVVDSNRRQRANVYARRGAANMELKLYKAAVSDYETAGVLCPELESLKIDKQKLEILLANENKK